MLYHFKGNIHNDKYTINGNGHATNYSMDHEQSQYAPNMEQRTLFRKDRNIYANR